MDLGNNRAVRAVRAALAYEGEQRFRVRPGPNLRRVTLRVSYGTSESVLAPVWAGEGFPKDVERALDDLTKSPPDPRETVVIAARRLSSGARAALQARGISWADEEGRAAIFAAPGLAVVREAAPSEPRPREEGMRWSEGAAAVAEHLLVVAAERALLPTGRGTALPAVSEIAGELDLSAPFVSRTLQSFDAMAWTAKEGPQRGTGARRVLTDATALLSGWAAWHRGREPETVHAHGNFQDPEAFLQERIGAWPGHAWALTGWLALERRATFMTNVSVITVYLDQEVFDDVGELGSWLTGAGLRRVESGARVDVVRADPYVLRQTRAEQGAPQVSDIRLYGDLLRLGVRGSDAAEHLRETRIGF